MKKNLRSAKKTMVGSSAVPVIQASPALGLTQQQVQQRVQAGLDNKPVQAPFKTIPQIIWDNVFTFFNLVFVILGVLLAIVHSYKDMLFLVIIVANTFIGIFQQIRSKNTLDKLTLISAPRVEVVREGSVRTIPSEQLVRDDIAIFSTGNQICADAVILEGEVQADESLLTGESDPISKKPGDLLLSGSFLLSGKCRARLNKVGAQSYASKLTLEAKKQNKTHQSEMMASLDKLIHVIGYLLIPIGLILFFKQHFILGLDLEQSVVSTVAALIGMIPEGLYLLTSIALAVSVINLARSKTLVHEMNCIETLARVDVLCVDKTGTITEPKMKVAGLIPLNSQWNKESVTQMLSAFYHHSEHSNSTAQAMQAYFSAGAANWKAAKTIPFLSSTKWSAVVFERQGTFVVGAPEFILKPMDPRIAKRMAFHSKQGERVLLAARLDGTIENNQLLGHIVPIALIVLSNPIRKNAPRTFQFFDRQGVAIKVISGDHPATVSQVAQQANIRHADKYIDASTLKTNEQIANAARQYTVFGRVTPDQKRKLIRALQRQRRIVAMTGDGVNDVLALKDADVSVAMASGSDAACQAANLVLLESDFSAMPKVVMEGRRVINNIQRAAALFLVKNIFSFLLSFVSVFVSIPYPITPLQLSLISAITIGIPSFLLAIEPNQSLVHGKFLHNVLAKAFPGGLTNFILIIGAQFFAFAFSLSVEELSTITTILLGFNGLLVLFQVCKPFNLIHMITWLLMAASMLVSVVFFGGFFSLAPLSLQALTSLGSLMLLNYPVLRAIMWIFQKFSYLGYKIERRAKRTKRKTKVYFRSITRRK